jgi:hypothetical protein
MTMQSPFPYDKLSLGTTFIGRQGEMDKLNQVIDSGNNLLLFSKRRLGKSSLIKKVFEQRTAQTMFACIAMCTISPARKIFLVSCSSPCLLLVLRNPG